MTRRRWLGVVLALVLVGVASTLLWLPGIVRHAVIARVHAVTGRAVEVDAVDLNYLTWRFAIRGFRLAERDGTTPFADFERLDVQLHLPSLLTGHVRLRDLVLTNSTVRVVRLSSSEFNLSDLVRSSGSTSTGRATDITVDHFALRGGRVTLEDRALPQPRTWTSEQITIDAYDLSTRRDDGRAEARSITAGSPVALQMRNVRLFPIHLVATVTAEGLDLTPARVYLPPDAPVVLERGRVTAAVTVTLDAREGILADARADLDDVALVQPRGSETLLRVPKLTMQVAGLGLREGALRLEQLALDGSVSVKDPAAKGAAPLRAGTLRATVGDLTWPATTAGRVDALASIHGRGSLAVTGTVQPPPAPSDLRLRASGVDLAPWAQFVPIAARITGLAEADLRINEPLAAGVPARVQGSIAVNRPAVADARRQVLSAQRIEASGLEVSWPERLVIKRVLVSGPTGLVERDRSGAFPLRDLLARPASAPAPASSAPAATPSLAVEIGEINVRSGAVAWHDETVSPAARLDLASIDARVTDVAWPLRGTAGVRASLRPPGGGRLEVTGRVGLDPLSADVRVSARQAALAPYRPYLPTTALVTGAADLNLAVAVPSLAEARATARGTAGLTRLDVRDQERTVMRIERATATGVDVDWPERIAVARLALVQPWMLLERDEQGALPLRALLAPPAKPAAKASDREQDAPREPTVVTVDRLTVDRGGIRVVDRAISPAFAVDIDTVALRMDGFSTGDAKPARLELSGHPGPGSQLTLRGAVRAVGEPLFVDVNAEVRDFAVPRTNPYVLSQAGWKTTEGRLTSALRCRIDGDKLSARTDVRVSRLQLVKASPEDNVQSRIGLPLGMLTSLMKDKRGDITVSLPVGGSLSDPRFDFSEAIWSAVRTVAINAVTRPVSWIGRVRFTPDSRIESIEIDPVPFEPGTPALTAEGQTQATRLAAFLDQLPEVKLALTPVIAARDITELRRRAVDAALERSVREGLSRDAAAARLFAERYPGEPVPSAPGAALATLLEREPVPTADLPDLAARRVDAVRAVAKQAGIDLARISDTEAVQRDDAHGRVEVEIAEQTQRPSRIRETLRKLGLPLKPRGER